jgi:hypothetical protein
MGVPTVLKAGSSGRLKSESIQKIFFYDKKIELIAAIFEINALSYRKTPLLVPGKEKFSNTNYFFIRCLVIKYKTGNNKGNNKVFKTVLVSTTS